MWLPRGDHGIVLAGLLLFFGAIDVMTESEVEWLSPEVIQELLEIELEPELSTPGPATNTKSQSMATPQVPMVYSRGDEHAARESISCGPRNIQTKPGVSKFFWVSAVQSFL